MTPSIIFLLISLSSPFQSTSASAPQPAYQVTEAYEVYSAILPSSWTWREANSKKLIIRSDTRTYDMCLRPGKEYEEIIGPAIADYVSQNQKAWILQKNLSIEKPYEIIRGDEIQSMFEQGLEGWKTFYEKYPDSGGWIELKA